MATRLAIWLLIVGLAPIVTAVTIIYFQRVESIRARSFAKLEAIRDVRAKQVSAWLTERRADLSDFVEDEEIIRAAELASGHTAGSLSERQRADVRRLLGRRKKHYASSGILLAGTGDGMVIVDSDRDLEGQSYGKQASFVGAVSERAHYVGAIVRDARGEPTMEIAEPVSCAAHQGQHLLAILVVKIDLDRSLYRLLYDRAGLGETGESLIVDVDRNSLSRLRWAEQAPMGMQINALPAARAARGETGTVVATDYRGHSVLAAYTNIPGTSWGLIVKQDAAEVDSPIAEMLANMLILVGISAVILVWVALFLARTLASPIQEIAATAARIHAGDLQARSATTGNDELGELGTAFNRMADAIGTQLTVLTGNSELAAAMLLVKRREKVASVALELMAKLTHSEVGALYLRSEDGATFECAAALGLTEQAPQTLDANSMEGQLGHALASKATTTITEIPADASFAFRTVVGDALPCELITVPIVVDEVVTAVLIIGSLHAYGVDDRELVDRAQTTLSAGLTAVTAIEKADALASELQASNEELVATNEELLSQASELTEAATELEEQRRQLEMADRLKSEFLANMSHELRTPLNSILALSQLMISGGTGKDTEKERTQLEIIERSGRQLLDLINDLLDLSKIEAGRADLIVGVLNAGDLVREVAETVQPLIEAKGLTLTVDCPAPIEMRSDLEKIRRVLLNLIGNAIKFTEEGGVTLRCLAHEQRARFEIIDTGIGISAEDQRHIFDEFRQVDGSTARRYEGTGLGLTISKRLARLLGGELTVDSELGCGSTFVLEMPLVMSDALGEPLLATVATAAAAGPVEGACILLVEDNEVAATQVRSVLEGEGIEVIVAEDGHAALRALAERRPDAIILDLMLPGMDGFEVLEALRAETPNEDLPVLVLTAKEIESADLARLKRNRIQQLVQKGRIDRRQLVDRVRSMLRRVPAALSR
ncbi:MAG: ATP-binding protein, partial [Myxococcota bacterium]